MVRLRPFLPILFLLMMGEPAPIEVAGIFLRINFIHARDS